MTSLSRVQFFATPWTVAHQASLSMGFSRQEYWSGVPFPPPGDLSNPGIETGSPPLQADTLPYEPPGKPVCMYTMYLCICTHSQTHECKYIFDTYKHKINNQYNQPHICICIYRFYCHCFSIRNDLALCTFFCILIFSLINILENFSTK